MLFKDLFIAVQSAQIYSDGKAFADAVPKAAPDEILKQYHAERPDSPAALKQFVEAHFILPSEVGAAPSPPDRVSIVAHIDGLWDELTRTTTSAPPYSSLLPLPQPYVVPGGRFREMYYWDSYFTMLGLAESGRRDLVTDMVARFRLPDRHLRSRAERRAHLLSEPLAAAVLLRHGRTDLARTTPRPRLRTICRSCAVNMPSGWKASRGCGRAPRTAASWRCPTGPF